jgi:hypothetical protein
MTSSRAHFTLLLSGGLSIGKLWDFFLISHLSAGGFFALLA